MQGEDFKLQIERLKVVFGDKNFDEERCKLIWGHAMELHANDFIFIVSTIIETSRYAPLPSDIIGEIRKAKKRRESGRHGHREHEPIPIKIHCAKCQDTGVVFVKTTDEAFSPAMGCDCGVANDWGLPPLVEGFDLDVGKWPKLMSAMRGEVVGSPKFNKAVEQFGAYIQRSKKYWEVA